jgi:hypothetical protein
MEWYLWDQAEASPKGASKLHKEVAQVLVPHTDTTYGLSHIYSIVGSSCDQLTEEENVQGWFTNRSSWHVCTTESGRLSLSNPTLGKVWWTVMKGNPSYGQDIERVMWLFILPGLIDGQTSGPTSIQGLRLMVWLDSQGLGSIGKLHVGKKCLHRPLQMYTEYGGICVPWEYPPQGDSAKEDFNSHVN